MFALDSETLVERAEIDHRSLMGSVSDLFYLIARRYLELNSLPFDLDHLGFGTNIMTDRCSGKVPYVYCGTNQGTIPQPNVVSALGGMPNEANWIAVIKDRRAD